jgi:hypothetical protein
MNDIVLVKRFDLCERDAFRRKPLKSRVGHYENAASQSNDFGPPHKTAYRACARLAGLKLYLRELQDAQRYSS